MIKKIFSIEEYYKKMPFITGYLKNIEYVKDFSNIQENSLELGVSPAFPCYLYPLFLGKFLFYTSPFIEDISINSYNNIKFRNINSPK